MKLRASGEMTETDNYLVDHGVRVGVDSESSPTRLKPSKNVIVPTLGENQTPIEVREASIGSTGLPLCRICLSEENDTDNPLFAPCKCAGTMKHIHLHCLQFWLNSRKITKETAFTKTFFWKNLECELCKTTYPNQVKMGSKNMSLRVIQYDTPVYQEGEQPCYVVFESVSANTSKVIHVVNFNGAEEIRIGRGHEADIRVTDISVTRTHAKLRKSTKGYFIIEDNKSKFGTLALIRSPFALSLNDANFIQCGRTLCEISIRRPIKLIDSCFCGGISNNNNRSSSIVRAGLATKNGFDYFPEEFIANKKKLIKKVQSESKLNKPEKQTHTTFHSEAFDDQGPPRLGMVQSSNLPSSQQQLQRLSLQSD